MEHTSLNPFVPNASLFRRPDGVFEIYLHLPGIISDLEVTPFASYLLVSGRHFLPGFQSEDGGEAELVWSDQPCGYFGRDIQLGMNNATEFIILESLSCQNSHVVRFSIRQKELSTGFCGEVMQRGNLSPSGHFSGRHVTPSTAQDAENQSHSIVGSTISHDASVHSNVGQLPVKSCPVHQALPNSAQQLATEDNSRRHVTFDAPSELPHNTFANGAVIYELPTSNQDLPVRTVLSNEPTVEGPQNPVPVAPVSGDTSFNNHGTSQFWTEFDDYHSSKPVLLPTDQTPVPDEHANHTENSTGDRALDGDIVAHTQSISTSSIHNTTHSLNAPFDQPSVRLTARNKFEISNSGDAPRDHTTSKVGETLTLPAQNTSIVKELMRQKIARDSADGESGNAQNNNSDITKDGPQASGFTRAGSSDEKVLASSSHRESGSVPVNVPDSSQEALPENGGRQPSAVNTDPTQTNIEFSAERESRDDGVSTDAINCTLQPSQPAAPSAPQTIRGPIEGGNGMVSMQPKDGEAISKNSEPPHEIHAVDSTSASAPQNAFISSEPAAIHHPATEKDVGNATIKEPVIPTESLVDQGSATTAPPEEQVETASQQKDPDGKLCATSQNDLASDTSTTENNVAASSAEAEDVAIPADRAEGPRDESTDSSHPMAISTESLDDGLVKVSKDRGDGDIVTTPRQPPDESNSVAQPLDNVPTPATTPLSYAEVAKKPHVDRTSRGKSGSPQSSYDFITSSTPDVSTSADHNLSMSTEPPTQPPSDKSTDKADESTYDFVSPDASTTADRNLSTSTDLPASTEKTDGTSTSISDGLRDVLAGDTGGQSSELVMPLHPLSLDERSPASESVV